MYVSSVGGGGIQHLSATGTVLGSSINGTRTDWIDLSGDQKTMLYTDEGQIIHRADVSTNTPLSNFGNTGGTEGFALRIIPGGAFGGDVLVAAGNQISLLDFELATCSSRIPTRTARTASLLWFALNLDPNGTAFWSGDGSNGEVAEFDIASGNVLQSRLTCGSVCSSHGLSVNGEITESHHAPEPATSCVC